MNTDRKLKYFTYCRKSSDSEDKQIASLPDQVLVLGNLRQKLGLTSVDVLSEAASAFKPGRSAFNDMLDRIEAGEGNAVIVWDPSRIARNSLDGGRFIWLMDQGKILELRTPSKVFYNTPDDKAMLSIDFTFAKKSSDDLSKNVLRGNAHKFFEKKEWGGVAKQGYLNFTDPFTKENKTITDPERFSIIKDGLHLLLAGKTPGEVFDWINNKRGYQTRQTLHHASGPMSRSCFYKIIKDPFYAGLMQRNIEGRLSEEMGVHEPMLTVEEFERLQVRLGRKGTPHYTAKEFPYKKVLRCGECGQSITCEEKWHIVCTNCKTKFTKTKSGTKCPHCLTLVERMDNPKLYCFVHYHCTKKKKHLQCSQGSINKKKLEKKISDEIARYEVPAEFSKWAIKYLGELNVHENQRDTQTKEAIHKRYTTVNQQIQSVVAIRISPAYNDYDEERKALYEQQEYELLEKRKAIKKELEEADKQQEKWIELAKDTFDFVSHARYWLEHGSVQEKTYVLSKLGSDLRILNKSLELNGAHAYFLVEKGKKEMVSVANRLEPKKYSELSAQMLDLEPVRAVWRKRRDSNPRSFRMTVFKTVALNHYATLPGSLGENQEAETILPSIRAKLST
jgi:site-specific DNA recombinase